MSAVKQLMFGEFLHPAETSRQESLEDIFGPVIHSYSRAEAIEDGVLIDVSSVAKEAGIKYPVAVTSALWDQCIVPGKQAKRHGQSEDGRLWDLLWMLYCQIKKGNNGRIVHYQVMFSRQYVRVKAICGPGDNPDPVITIMLPEED